MRGFTLKPIDGMCAIHDGAVKLAGAELGVESFGIQILDLPASFSHYPEHDHASDGQEEVYLVLRGTGEFELDGERVTIDPGSVLWVAPGTRRRLDPGPEGVRVAAIGSAPGHAYERPAGFRLAATS